MEGEAACARAFFRVCSGYSVFRRATPNADVAGCRWRCEWSELNNRVLTVDLGGKVVLGVAAVMEDLK